LLSVSISPAPSFLHWWLSYLLSICLFLKTRFSLKHSPFSRKDGRKELLYLHGRATVYGPSAGAQKKQESLVGYLFSGLWFPASEGGQSSGQHSREPKTLKSLYRS
jgi:hypothetical protein